VGLPHEGWEAHFSFTRDPENEAALYYDVLGLEDDSDYILVNKKYGSPPGWKEVEIVPQSDQQVVEMGFYPHFTLFDWCKVLEKAAEIYTVDTAINYILEKLNVKDTKLHLYSRFTDCGGAPDWSHIEGLFLKEWIYYNE